MEQVGGRGTKTNVDREGSIINEVKNGGNKVDNVHDNQGEDETEGDGDDVSAVEPSIAMDEVASSDGCTAVESGKKKKRTKRKAKNGKPPGAPKRFKSSFIFFSMAKYKELKEKYKSGEDVESTRMTSMVSKAWRSLEPSGREKFEEMSRQDKLRYQRDKQNYPGTLVESKKRKKKLGTPKRPMSAYLIFANKQRAQVKAQNPNASNGEISKILSGMWKEMPGDEKQQYREQEQCLWKIYKQKMVLWKQENDRRTIKGNMNAASGVTEPLFGVRSVSGVDSNPNTSDISMAVSALRGVRGMSQQHFGVGSSDSSQQNEYNGVFGLNSTSGMQPMLGRTGSVGQAGYGQMDMSAFQYNQYGYLVGGNNHAMIMAQLGGKSQQFPRSMMPITQQSNLSAQLASLVDVQNSGTLNQQRQALDQAIDQAIKTGITYSKYDIPFGLPGDGMRSWK